MPLGSGPPLRLLMRLALAGLVLLLAGHWWWESSGAALWLAVWDADVIPPTYGHVVVLLVLAVAVPVSVGFWLANLPSAEDGHSQPLHLLGWCKARSWRVGWLLGGLLVGFWGAFHLTAGLDSNRRLTVDAAEIEASHRPAGRWLEISGRLLADDRIICEGPQTVETYVPLVSASWREGQPLAVLIRAREDNYGEPGRLLHHRGPSVTGLVDPLGARPDVAQRFGLVNFTLADPVVIVDYEARPGDDLVVGYIGVAMGLAIILITGLVWIVKR
jgi:hypothetical protein